MIILDTNVLSEIVKNDPNSRVVAWLGSMAEDNIWVTAITVHEVNYGLERMSAGRKRRVLKSRYEAFFSRGLRDRVLPLDEDSAVEAARLRAWMQTRGRTIELPDTLIAGIALANRATIATRNARHFADVTVPVVDPWAG